MVDNNVDPSSTTSTFLETFQDIWENPTGIAIIVVTMIVSFILFPPQKSEAEEDKDDTSLQNKYLAYTAYAPRATWTSDMKVLKAMWFSKITGNDLQERLNSFYKDQADLYDSYRIRMLHGRPLMLKAITRNLKPPNAATKKKGIVWVDLACGTGYNMESFNTCLDKFSRIYLLDLCVPLCDVAKRDRADKYNKTNGNNKKIHVIHGDATDFECEGLPQAGTVDLVTISYSLVMIPNWEKAIENAKRLLKPGTGMIGICDFTIEPNQSSLMKRFWINTFKQDHVYLNENHLRTLYKEFNVVDAAGAYGSLPYTPIFLQPAYYYFIGTKKDK